MYFHPDQLNPCSFFVEILLIELKKHILITHLWVWHIVMFRKFIIPVKYFRNINLFLQFKYVHAVLWFGNHKLFLLLPTNSSISLFFLSPDGSVITYHCHKRSFHTLHKTSCRHSVMSWPWFRVFISKTILWHH